MTRYLSVILLVKLASCEISREGGVFRGEDYAREALHKALAETVDILPVDKVLIEDENTAIVFAEVILFKVYGRKRIASEQPYEIHNIDGYWIINGTLPKGDLGGHLRSSSIQRTGKSLEWFTISKK